MKAPAIPWRAMVLGAGLGLRMRPLTDKLPKPLVQVGGRTLLDSALDRLVETGVEKVVINLYHLGHLIEEHLRSRSRPEIAYSREEALLDTGGGVLKALPLLGKAPFFVVNGDVLWLNGPRPALTRLATTWDDKRMDALLMLHETVDAFGYDGPGDFTADAAGVLARRPECEIAPYVFTGVQIIHPRLLAEAPAGAFSLNVLYDRAIGAGRLYGMVHDGAWFHVGTPDGLAVAESYLHDRYPGDVKRR